MKADGYIVVVAIDPDCIFLPLSWCPVGDAGAGHFEFLDQPVTIFETKQEARRFIRKHGAYSRACDFDYDDPREMRIVPLRRLEARDE